MRGKMSRPVLIVFSILAACQVLTGAAALGDIIGKDLFALFILVVASVQAGMSFYVNAQVTENSQVGAVLERGRGLVAGPAATTIPDGQKVELTPVPPSTANPLRN